VSLFLAHMDYGHWLRSFQIQISTGKWFIWVVTSWTIATTSSQVIIDFILSDLDAYYLFYLLEMKSYITRWMSYLLDDITTLLRYYSMELSFSTCYLQVTSPGQTLRQMSSSPMYVNIQGYASLQSTYLIMLVLLVHLLFFL